MRKKSEKEDFSSGLRIAILVLIAAAFRRGVRRFSNFPNFNVA
jgi:hypothetical protein